MAIQGTGLPMMASVTITSGEYAGRTGKIVKKPNRPGEPWRYVVRLDDEYATTIGPIAADQLTLTEVAQ